MDLSENKLSPKAETEGVWVPYDNETSFLVARFLNTHHSAYVNKRMEPFRRLQRMGKLDDKIVDEIEVDAMARHVLLGWKGLKNNGKEIKYSVDEAIKLLSDPALSWLMDLIRTWSQDISLFREEALAETETVVKKLSSGQ